MDYTTELNRINDKYYNKIKKEYSKYSELHRLTK